MFKRTTDLLIGIASVFLAALLFSYSSTSLQAAADQPPNIVFILVDDQGYYDLGCYGAAEVKTPSASTALAKAKGTRFTDYYAAAPICSPSRAGILLTGCYPRTRRQRDLGPPRRLRHRASTPTRSTLAELLFKANGYATACVGKWHLGFHKPFLPPQSRLRPLLRPPPQPRCRSRSSFFKGKGGVPLLLRNGDVVKRPAEPAELTQLVSPTRPFGFIERNKAAALLPLPPAHHAPQAARRESRSSKARSQWGEYGDAIQELDHHTSAVIVDTPRRTRPKNAMTTRSSSTPPTTAAAPAAPRSSRSADCKLSPPTRAASACRPSPGGRNGDCRKEQNRRRSSEQWTGIRLSLRSLELRSQKTVSLTGAISALY